MQSPDTAASPRLHFPLPQWLAPALLLLAAVVGTWVFFVQSTQGQLIDAVTWQTADHRMQFMREPVRDFLNILPQLVGSIAVAAFVILTLFQRRFFASLVALVMFGITNVVGQLLKNFLFTRPDLGTGLPYYTGNSLPSGHTVFAAAAGFALVLVARPQHRNWVSVCAAILATAVGVATFIETWHRPADMIAAYFLAGGIVLLAAAFLTNYGRQENTLLQQHRSQGTLTAVILMAVGLAIICGAVLAFAFAGGQQAWQYPFAAYSMWHYLAGVGLSAGPGFFTFGLVLWLLNRVRPQQP